MKITDRTHAHSVGSVGNRSTQNDDDLDLLLREGLRHHMRVPAQGSSTWAKICQRIASGLRGCSTLEQKWAGAHVIQCCREPLSWNAHPDLLYLMPLVRLAM